MTTATVNQKPSRITNPEYVALREAVEVTRPSYEAAAAELAAIVAENPWLMNDLADRIARGNEILTGHRQAVAFVAARAPYNEAQNARMEWIDAHPEYR